MPAASPKPIHVLHDGAFAMEGSRAFDFFAMKPGVIGRSPYQDESWFEFTYDDGTYSMLDGRRVVSMDEAKKVGWRK